MSFWSRLFGGKQRSNESDGKLAWIGCDMHNHILPGIDDGSKTVEESLLLLQGLKDLGISKCISTPHVMQEVHNNTPSTISAAHKQLKEGLDVAGMKFDIQFSAEYMIDDQLQTIISQDQVCLLPNQHMLIEMSYLAESKALFKTIKDIQEKGYQPILAHPERYNYYHQNFKIYKEIKDAGCLLRSISFPYPVITANM